MSSLEQIVMLPNRVLLPSDWIWHESRGRYYVAWPGTGGNVTLDFVQRGWALGQVSYVPEGTYMGRGWKQRLADDAVAALKEIYKDEK